jgi:hypothetical protein
MVTRTRTHARTQRAACSVRLTCECCRGRCCTTIAPSASRARSAGRAFAAANAAKASSKKRSRRSAGTRWVPGSGGTHARISPRVRLVEAHESWGVGTVAAMCGGAGLVLGRGRAYGAKPCLTQRVDELRCAAQPNRLRHGRFAERDGCRTAHADARGLPHGRKVAQWLVTEQRSA